MKFYWPPKFRGWNPFSWLGEIARLNRVVKVKERAYELCCAQRELLERQKDHFRDKLVYAALRLQQKEKQVANLNAEANAEITKLSSQPGYELARTSDLPTLERHARISMQADWMLLEDYQKRASQPMPQITVEVKDKNND